MLPRKKKHSSTLTRMTWRTEIFPCVEDHVLFFFRRNQYKSEGENSDATQPTPSLIASWSRTINRFVLIVNDPHLSLHPVRDNSCLLLTSDQREKQTECHFVRQDALATFFSSSASLVQDQGRSKTKTLSEWTHERWWHIHSKIDVLSVSASALMMNNSSMSLSDVSPDNWCIPWTRSVYLYGHIIPAIALCIFGLTFNLIALYYFSTSSNFRRSVYSYYFSAIAVVDLTRLTLWSLFLLLDYKIFKLNFRSFECPLQTFAESVASCISAWLTVSLTVERCLVIYKPFQTITDTKGKRALILIICVILASCLVNSLFLQPGFYVERWASSERSIFTASTHREQWTSRQQADAL